MLWSMDAVLPAGLHEMAAWLLTALAFALVGAFLWQRMCLLLPESLIPKIRLDERVKYHGTGVYEARPGNAMWCQDSAQDYFEHGVRIHPGMTVLDVGANVGLFALELLERLDGEARVYCFEPIPATCSLLRLNMARYPEAQRPRVLNCGLSDEAAFVTFQVCPETNIISTSHPELDPQVRAISRMRRTLWVLLRSAPHFSCPRHIVRAARDRLPHRLPALQRRPGGLSPRLSP
jgi:hypothetical protein